MTTDQTRSLLAKPPSLERARFRALTRKSSGVGFLKVGAYAGAILALSLAYAAFPGAGTTGIVVVALGIVFAHGVELQHEALHHNLFGRSFLNRAAGIVLGAPMLVSYTHYRSYHFHHHVAVGSDDDEEIVDYALTSFSNPVKLALRAWNVSRVPRFFLVLFGMLRGRYPARVKAADRGRLLFEYLLLATMLSAMLGGAIVFSSWAPIALWFAPWLLVAEPLHFIIEVPEHLGCDRRTPSILHNTRSYRTNPVWGYLANHNNYHIEHHLWPGVPAHRLHRLHPDVVGANGHCSAGFGPALAEVRQTIRSIRQR